MHILLPLLLIGFVLWVWGTWGPGGILACLVFLISTPLIWFAVYGPWPDAAVWVALAGGWWLARKASRAFA